jgi:hypothetical protein
MVSAMYEKPFIEVITRFKGEKWKNGKRIMSREKYVKQIVDKET